MAPESAEASDLSTAVVVGLFAQMIGQVDRDLWARLRLAPVPPDNSPAF